MSNSQVTEQLEKLIEVGIALSSEVDQDKLLEMILFGAKSLTQADGASLYRIEGESVRMTIAHSDSLGFWQGGTSGEVINMPEIPLFLIDGAPNMSNVVCYSYHNNQTVNIDDVYNDNSFDWSGPKKFDKQNSYLTRSILAVPLINHEKEIIGILQLINAIDQAPGGYIAFDPFAQQLTESLASLAAMVLTKQNLINSLETMFESLIELIATAIDDKSPYTAGHCRRVPELTMMLAEAAHETDTGYLKTFSMTDKDRYELKIAGWLHDCGKITTPEYVVDKATKLETIFDRIALLETRFELLKRDAEIDHLKKSAAALEKGEAAPSDALLKSTIEQIEQDLDFIKRSNTGGEFMSEDDKARVRTISTQQWTLNGESMTLLSDDEVENLTITRGTLNTAEREVINHHIEATISMLSKIDFPKHLNNVLEYAAGHHERMDGKGYPRRLKREQMSIQARVMAIADIFEALTAGDRPYKDGKKLSEALSILEKMKQDHHIDPDLYDAFIAKKVYLLYAEQFLELRQIDVD